MQRMSATSKSTSRKAEKVSEMQEGAETGQSGAHIKQVSSSWLPIFSVILDLENDSFLPHSDRDNLIN